MGITGITVNITVMHARCFLCVFCLNGISTGTWQRPLPRNLAAKIGTLHGNGAHFVVPNSFLFLVAMPFATRPCS